MRILYHHRTAAEDGQAVHVRDLIRAFRRAGHEVAEVALVRHDAALRGAARGGSGWRALTRMPRFAREIAEYGYSAVGRGRILKAAARLDPHFIYERYAFGCLAGAMAKERLRKPLVLEVNAPMVLELAKTRGLSFGKLARQVEDRVWRAADLVCPVTGVLAEMVIERGVPRERVLVMQNGVELARYEYPDRAQVRRRARADLGLPEEALALGFVGYVRDWHRLDLALEALASSELGSAWLVVIGDGPARAGLEKRAEELGLCARVRFTGARAHEHIPELLPAFDIALVPAINAYASPLKLFEYMAAGLAVVAPDQANLREVLADGSNGVLIARDDAKALNGALARLAGDPGTRAQLGAAARHTLLERELTWDANARRIAAAVEALR